MLKKERAATLTQFLVTRLVMQGGEEADGPLVSQDVQETRKFAVEAAGYRHKQGEKGLVVVTEVIWTAFVSLRFRHSRVNEQLVRIGVARLTVTCRVDDVAMKIMNKCDVDDEVRRPSHIQPLISKSPRRWPRLVGTRLPRLVRKPAACAMSAMAERRSSV